MSKTYPEKCITCSYFEHFASCYACSTCKVLQNSIVNDINESESILLQLTPESIITMEVHGKTKTYRPIKDTDDSWDMDVVGEENASYGLSCKSLKELKYLLLADYATEIITKVTSSHVIKIKSMKVKCIENQHNNTNFTEGKEYEASTEGIRCDWGGMWTKFKDWNKPKSFNVGDVFEFAMCKFEVIA